MTTDAQNCSSGRFAAAAVVWLLVASFHNQGCGVNGQDVTLPSQTTQTSSQPQLQSPQSPLPSSMQQFISPQLQSTLQQNQQSQRPPQQPQQQTSPSQSEQQMSQPQFSPLSQQQMSQPQFSSQSQPQPQFSSQSQQQMPPPQFSSQPQSQTLPPQFSTQSQPQTPPPQFTSQSQSQPQFSSQSQQQMPQSQFQPKPLQPQPLLQQQQQQQPSPPQQQFQQQMPQQPTPSQSQQPLQRPTDRPSLMEPLNMTLQPSTTTANPSFNRPATNSDSKLNPSQPTTAQQSAASGSLPQGSAVDQPQQDSIPAQQTVLQKPLKPLQSINNALRPTGETQIYGDQLGGNYGSPIQIPAAENYSPSRLAKGSPVDSVVSVLNPSPYMEKSMGMANSAIGKVQDYTNGLKNGVGTVALDVGFKLLDGGQSLVHGLANAATAIPDTLFDLKRKGLLSLGDMLNLPPRTNAGASSSNNNNNNYYSAGYGYQPPMMAGGYQGQMEGSYQAQMGPGYQMNGGYPPQMMNGGYAPQMNGYQQPQFPMYPQQQQQQQLQQQQLQQQQLQQQQLQQQQQQRPNNRNQNSMSNGQNLVNDPQPIINYGSY